ncbi:MAG TPA: hypothetical protein ENJ45_05380 [Phaeodactylibacter sp.]|nr:hypothetical protein [Phaeodactylibacter sp.]
MNKYIQKNLIRIVLFVAIQVLVFKHVPLGPYAHILFYPLAILLLPIEMNATLLMLIAFLTGLVVDLFYHSLGVHAGAIVLMAFLRPTWLLMLQPHLGYDRDDAPLASGFGLIWYLQYTSVLIFVFLLAYFSFEAFSFAYLTDILSHTVLSFVVTMIMVLIHQMIFNPKR